MNFRCVLSIIKKLPKDYVVPLLWPPASALIPVPHLVLAGSITAAPVLTCSCADDHLYQRWRL